MTTASPPSALDGTLLLLHPELRLSPAQLAPLCEANPDAVLDLSATGQLIQITPAGGDTPLRTQHPVAVRPAALRRHAWRPIAPTAPSSAGC